MKKKPLYYVLSKLQHHASAVVYEDDTTLVIQKLKVGRIVHPFTNDWAEEILDDEAYEPRTESKSDLLKVFDDVELTKDYWRLYEYMTGRKRKAVAENTENA